MESQELYNYFDEPLAPRKSFTRRRKEFIEMPSDGPRYMIAMVPIRLSTFVLTLTLLALLTYIHFHSMAELAATVVHIIGGTAISFLFFSVTQIIGFYSNTEMFECPMLLCSLAGVICFLFMGTYLAYVGPTRSYARLIAFIICFIIGFLYALDITLAIGYWRHKYSYKRKLVSTKRMHSIYDSHIYNQTSPQLIERAYKGDVQTSMTGTGIILDPYDDDPFGRYWPRRSGARLSNSYVERPVRSEFATMASRGMQSDYSPIQREAQTTIVEVKEMPVQTSSKCDLCQRPIEVEPDSVRQHKGTTNEVSVSSKPTVATSARKSIPVQTVPTHTTQSSSPTRMNLICFCKHQANYAAPLNSTVGPTGVQSCGSCNSLALTIAKILTAHQHKSQLEPQPQLEPQLHPEVESQSHPEVGSQPHSEVESQPHSNVESQPHLGVESQTHHEVESQPYPKVESQLQPIPNAPTSPRHIETGTNPNFDMNLNADPSDEHRVKQTYQVYKALPSPSQTNPFIGKLAPISHVHKNKRTQTKGLSTIEHSNLEKENEIVWNMSSGDREEIDEEKFIVKEIEVRSIDLNSPHKVMPKHELTPEKRINVKSHGPPSGRRIIEVKERKNDREELDLSKTRTKTLYRETLMRPTRIENVERNKMPSKSDRSPRNVERKTSAKIPYSQVRKETKSNTTASSTIEGATSIRPIRYISDKNETSERKGKSKNIGQDKAIGRTGRRFQSRSNSGSSLFRPRDLSKKYLELNSSTKDWTPQPLREPAADESEAESGLIESEIFKQSRQIEDEPNPD